MLFRKLIPTLAVITLALFVPTLSLAGSATISWRANTEGDLAGYRLYYGTATRSYGPPVPVGNVTRYTLANLTDGRTYYFGVTALDYSGNESGYSAEAQKTISTSITSTSTGSSTGTAVISNLSVASGKAYQILTGLSNNLLCYIDRSYKYSNVPSFLNGATFIKTANDDKYQTNTNFLRFTANSNVTVYVAYDNRNAKPAWLSTFDDTKADLKTDVSFSIYQKNFSAGNITLGGNQADGSMYTVMIKPLSASSVTTTTTATTTATTGGATISNLSVASGKAYQILTGLSNNLLCYIDRSYKYSNIPSFLNGATFIKTANDDKYRTNTNFLTFTANSNVTVYVAYDNRDAKPAWLSTFNDTKADLKTDVSFSIYQKNFLAGNITLGGNQADGSMYTVMIKSN